MRTCLRYVCLIFTWTFAVFVSPCLAQTRTPAQLDYLLQSITVDAVERGYLARVNWVSAPLPYALGPTDESLRQQADGPLSRSMPSNLSPGLTTFIDRTLNFGELRAATATSESDHPELKYFARVLYHRPSVIIRWLPFVSEYSTPRRRSSFVEEYFDALRSWALLTDTVAMLESQGVPQGEIESAKRLMKEKYRQLEGNLSGAAIRMISYRATAIFSRTDRLAWDSAIHQFEVEGGRKSAASGDAGPILFSAVDYTPWQTIETTVDGRVDRVSYQLRPIRRPWLEDTLLFYRSWNWSGSSPYHLVLADGTNCEANERHNCVAERIVFIRDVNAIENEQEVAIGFVGEKLPTHPSTNGRENENIPPIGFSNYRISDVAERLRDGTF